MRATHFQEIIIYISARPHFSAPIEWHVLSVVALCVYQQDVVTPVT
jgi:hypothetical protein